MKEEKKIINIYISDDGKEFDDKKKCLEHEEWEKKEKVHILMDTSMHIICVYKNIDKAKEDEKRSNSLIVRTYAIY